MVAQEDAPLRAVGDRRRLRQDLLDGLGLLLAGGHEHAGHEREVEAHVALVGIAEVVDDVGRPLVGLGQQHPTRELPVHDLAHPLQVVVGLGQVLAVGAVGLEQVRHGVEAEPVEAQPQPVPHHVDHGVGHVGVAEVEVGLVVEEPVPVVLLALGVPRPVRRLGVHEDHPGFGPPVVVVVPHVPVGPGVGTGLARLLEPGVLVRRVVHHHVGDDPHAPAVGLVDQFGGVAHRAVVGVHAEEVGDVVPAVGQGRLVERQQPEAVDAQPLQVVELLGDPAQVTGAVAAGVVEPPDQHLVEDGPAVPLRIVDVHDRRSYGRPTRSL